MRQRRGPVVFVLLPVAGAVLAVLYRWPTVAVEPRSQPATEDPRDGAPKPTRVAREDPSEAAEEAARTEAAWASVARDRPGYVVCDAGALTSPIRSWWQGVEQSDWSCVPLGLRAAVVAEGVLSAATTSPSGSTCAVGADGRRFEIDWSGVTPGGRGGCSVVPEYRLPVVPPEPGWEEPRPEKGRPELAAEQAELARHEALLASTAGAERVRLEAAVAQERAEVAYYADAVARAERWEAVRALVAPVVTPIVDAVDRFTTAPAPAAADGG